MRSIVLIGVLGGALAGCSSGVGQEASSSISDSSKWLRPRPLQQMPAAPLPRALSKIADLADRGSLLSYTASAPVRHGASTWRPVELSEAYAIRAITEGGMVVQAPDGHPIRLQYERHIEHPDGNWTWVGRPAGAQPGTEAILTFGEQAVFGTIPDGGAQALEIGTSGGRTWMVQTDAAQLASEQAMASAPQAPDAVSAPVAMAGAAGGVGPRSSHPVVNAAGAKPSSAALMASAAAAPASGSGSTSATAGVTVDLALGFTTAFASRLGGQSQAVTRLNSMVDIANQALLNSRVGGQLRLVRTVEVNYADNTQNRAALMELSGLTCTNTAGAGQVYLPDSGVNCTTATVPAALQPLLAARDQSGADLAVLVRNFTSPENQSCGVAWLIGGAQTAVNASGAAFGLSVVSDSSGSQFPSNGSVCRSETLAHEVGHNLGLAHDRTTAAGSDDSNGDSNLLDPEEFGRYPYAFGYSTDSAHGNFYDIMSVPSIGQTSFRVYSNPRVTFCGGAPCGVSGQEDNALALGQTLPVVATFRAPRFPVAGIGYRGDYDGDGKSDILWHNAFASSNVIWKAANGATTQAVSTVADHGWIIVGAGDFDGDGKSDILWHHAALGSNAIWKAGNAATSVALLKVPDEAWTVVGVGDFNGDHKADILWRNISTGANLIWKSGNGSSTQAVATVSDLNWAVVGIGDLDGDGKDDIVWRNLNDGRDVVWKSANSATAVSLTWVTSQAWVIVGVGDFDGDGKGDVLWRNANTGANVIWKAGSSTNVQAMLTVAGNTWVVVGIGDFDGDGKDDILWRNSATGGNVIWKSGNASTTQAVTTVTSQSWVVAG